MHRSFTNEDTLNISQGPIPQHDSISQRSFLKYPVLARVQRNGHHSMQLLSCLAAWGQSSQVSLGLGASPRDAWRSRYSKGVEILHLGLPTPRSVVFPLGWLPAVTERHWKPRSSRKHGVSSPTVSSGRAHKQQRFPHYPQTCVNIATARNVTKKNHFPLFPLQWYFLLGWVCLAHWKGQLISSCC